MFLKRNFPVLIAFLTGTAFALQFYVPHEFSQKFAEKASGWMTTVAYFILMLGVISVMQVHAQKMRRQESGWGYSVVLFIAMIAMVVTGAIAAGKPLTKFEGRTAYGFLYNYLMVPLQSTMFATLAFYVASAAFRAFRARNLGAFLLLFFAIIMLFGKASLGESFWATLWGNTELLGWKVGTLGTTIEWLMATINSPVKSAILIGAAFGMIATSMKVIFGIERAYMGGKGE